MTQTLAQPALTGAAEVPAIPAISAAELDVMQAAAVRFLHARDAGGAIGEMRLLREACGVAAAGRVSAHRDEYVRRQGCHFMMMPYRAS